MRKRGFIIPMTICTVVAMILHTLQLYLSYECTMLFLKGEGIGAALGSILGLAGNYILFIFILALSIPVWILSGIYCKKAKRNNVITWPGVTMRLTCIGMVTFPVTFYLVLLVASYMYQ